MMQAFPCLRGALTLVMGVFKEDEQTAHRRQARQKRHAAALSRSGYQH